MAEGYRKIRDKIWSSNDLFKLPEMSKNENRDIAETSNTSVSHESTSKGRRNPLRRQITPRNAPMPGDMVQEEENREDTEAKNTPEELQTQLSRNNDRGHSNYQRQICRLTGLCVFLLDIVILISLGTLAGVRDQHTENQQTKILLENLETNFSSMPSEVTTMSKKVEFIMKETGWHLTRDGLSYKRFSSFQNFSKAQQVCENQNARLASTGIRDEQVRKELLNAVFVKIKVGQWIGLKKPINSARSAWAWSDGARYTYESTPWEESQPNNKNGGCGIAFNENARLVLYDSACEEEHPFVCERQ